MKKMKKTLCLFLALVMCLGMVNLSAFAEEGEEPICTCGTENDIHTEDCALYVLEADTEEEVTGPAADKTTDTAADKTTDTVPSESQETAEHEHVWDGGKVTTEPTCTVAGEMTYTCTVEGCGETKTQGIAPTHKWSADSEITKEPTCTETGVRTYHCTVEGCDATTTTEIPTRHTFNNGVVTTEPTCKAAGVKTHTCTECGATTTSTVPATGEHTWDEGMVTTEPTDTEDGEKTFTCTVCGEIKTEIIAATHSSSSVATINDIGYPTLQDAIDAAQSGDTIVLVKDFSLTGDEKRGNDWLNTVTASKTPELTIDLGGHTVDCNNQFGWLHVNNNTTMDLTVKNGTIQNAANCSQGSAIWAFGTLTLENMTIQNCTSSSYGGAVYVGTSDVSTNLTVKDCTFTGNHSKGTYASGGAIWVGMAKKVNISNTTFTNNTADMFAGAFYVDHGAEGVALNNCTFTGNEALYGGAVSSYDNCSLTVTDCKFENNHADGGSGGAINATGNQPASIPGTLTVNGNTTFTGNTATYGGAVYASYLYPSKLEHVTFDGNAAGNGYGGAAYCYAVKMTLDNVTATSNSASHYGGGFFLQSAPTTVTGSTITGNKAGYGGGLYCTQSAVTVNGGKVTGNEANYGGGIANYFDKLTLTNGAEVHNNTAKKSGDDIYSSDAKYHETYPASLELVVAENAVLESDGKTITGWFIDGQEGESTTTNRWGVEDFYKEFDGQNSVVALKAAYEPYYTITYTDGVEDSEVFADQSYQAKKGEKTPVFNGTPAREGYTFTGWDKEIADTVTGDVTYTAQWQEVYNPGSVNTTYTLHYNANGGSGAPKSQSQTNNRTFTISSEQPTREGYTFLGWSSVRTGEEAEYFGEDSFRIAKGTSQTLYAAWTPEEDIVPENPPLTTQYNLVVEYQYEDGSKAADTVENTFYAGDSYSITSPVIDGYTVDIELVEGTMPEENVKILVVYKPVSIDVPDEETPTTDLPDEQPPLVDLPDEQPPLVDLPDEQPPLTQWPDTIPVVDVPDEQPPMVDIPVEDVPMVGIPQTGDFSMVWYVAALLSMVGLAVLTLKKREDEKN